MVKFDMIDTVQMGIRKIFDIQRNRYFPLPDYDLSTPQMVVVTVYGKVLDENYTRLIFSRDDLDLDIVFLLDRVQKKQPLEKEQYQMLKKLGLVEGKIPNVYVSATIAEITDGKAQYIKNKAMDDQFYKKMVTDYLKKWGKGTKSDFVKLLGDKLPDILDEKQKIKKVSNLLAAMSRAECIEYLDKNQRTGSWTLTKKSN
jgi:ATP-dependent DNA helicase RecG